MAGRVWCVFSYSHSHIGRVVNYIKNQENHHAQNSFRTEYLEMLSRFEISHEEKYVFDFFERASQEAPDGAK